MTYRINRSLFYRLMFIAMLTFLVSFNVQAQNSFVLSSHSGADTSESFFAEGSTLYMYVHTNELDVRQMKKMRWTIENAAKGEHEMGMDYKFSGDFTNNFDSTFTASFDLSKLPEGGKWEWKARLEDNRDHEVELETYFYYKNSDSDSSYSYMEMEGSIQSIGDDSLVINNYVFYVDSNTVVEYKDDHNYSFGNLKVNDFVEVKARLLDDGSYLAIKIELKEEMGHHHKNYVKAKGVIEDVTDSSVTVQGKTFYVDSETEIKGRHDSYLTLSDLTAGMFVEIKALLQDDGSYLAIKIEVEERKEEAFEIEFKGAIDSLGTDYLVIGGQKILVTDQTEIEIKKHQKGALSDLQIGMKIEVKALRLNDGSLLAVKIEVEDGENGYQKIELTGAIDSLSTDFIILLGYTVYVDTNTIILDGRYMPATLNDLKKGQIVKVKGFIQDDGSVLAYKIKAKDFWMAHFNIEGVIEALSADKITVQGVTFNIDSATIFYNYDHTPIQFTDLTVGQTVKVKAVRETDGSYLALTVKLTDKNKTHIEVTGPIQYIGADSVKVNDVMFFVDSATVIYDLQDNPMPFADLKIDQIVEVKGVLQADGNFWAMKIELEDDPEMVTVNSSLGGKSETTVIIANTEYKVSPSTVVVDSNYNVIDLSGLTLGDDVTVWAVPSSDGGYEALQIQSVTNTAVTSVGDLRADNVIRSFSLKQNYPNPFNPSTTIEFVLNRSGFANVKLEVYNMLGQKVKTLFNGVLDAGSYKFRWDGRNEASQKVASGMYIYRLEVDQKAMVKQMVLIK